MMEKRPSIQGIHIKEIRYNEYTKDSIQIVLHDGIIIRLYAECKQDGSKAWIDFETLTHDLWKK